MRKMKTTMRNFTSFSRENGNNIHENETVSPKRKANTRENKANARENEKHMHEIIS